MNEELKPCPYCGAPAVLKMFVGWGVNHRYYVICNGDDCDIYPSTQNFDTKEEAIKAWNRRT